jgi:hypothetical protein
VYSVHCCVVGGNPLRPASNSIGAVRVVEVNHGVDGVYFTTDFNLAINFESIFSFLLPFGCKFVPLKLDNDETSVVV